MDYKFYIDLFAALLTPTIAIVTTFIAIQQYRNSKRKFRHELYDKRLAIFNATVQFIATILRDGDISIQDLYKFNADTSETYFLFEKDVFKYLNEMYTKGVDLHITNEELHRGHPSDAERKELAEKDGEILKWFGGQVEGSRHKFARYLSVKSLK
jgi:hypothetical protein